MSTNETQQLTNWAEKHIREVMTAKTKADFDLAFTGMFKDDADITVNGHKTSVEQYRKMLWRDAETPGTSTVDFRATVAVPAPSKGTVKAGDVLGEVGTFFEVAKFQVSIKSSMNMIVEWTENSPSRPGGIHPTDYDGSQVTTLNQVIKEHTSGVEQPGH